MRDFLYEFVRRSDAVCTMIVVDEEYAGRPRRYRLRPFRVLVGGLGVLLLVSLVTTAAVAFTPLRTLIPGYGTVQMEQDARRGARRAAALEDSLREQRRHLRHLQRLMAGPPVDSAFVAEVQRAERAKNATDALLARGALGAEDQAGAFLSGRGPFLRRQAPLDEEAGARTPFDPARLPEDLSGGMGAIRDAMRSTDLDALQFPVALPAEGFVTRGFDAEGGHYAVDVAAEVGTPVHTIGDGYVVMAGRTEQGGQVIAVQHAGGYLSLYKHNSMLLKRVGERVEARAVIAESGNSGKITTGPHLHVELWRNGLAQDPAAYFLE